MPTVLARFAHHLPRTVLRLGTVFSLVVELAGPFLFFAPVRRLRLAAFYMQVRVCVCGGGEGEGGGSQLVLGSHGVVSQNISL